MCFIVNNDHVRAQWRPAYADRAVRHRMWFQCAWKQHTKTLLCPITRVLDVFSQLFVRLPPLEPIADDSLEWAVCRDDDAADAEAVWCPVAKPLDLIRSVSLSFASCGTISQWDGDYVRRVNESLDLSHCELLTDDERACGFMVPLDTCLQGRPFPHHLLQFGDTYLTVRFYTRRRVQRRAASAPMNDSSNDVLSPSHNAADDCEPYVVEIGNKWMHARDSELGVFCHNKCYQCIVHQHSVAISTETTTIPLTNTTERIRLISSVPLESLDGVDLRITYSWHGADTEEHSEPVSATRVAAGMFDITPASIVANAMQDACKGTQQYAAATQMEHIGQATYNEQLHCGTLPPSIDLACMYYCLSEEYYGSLGNFLENHVPTVALTHGEYERAHHHWRKPFHVQNGHVHVACDNIVALAKQGIYLSLMVDDKAFLVTHAGLSGVTVAF
jgi:hypothetical protein